MQTTNMIEPAVTFREDILKLHILYLEKCDSLSKGEREAYEMYFKHLDNPKIFINSDNDIEMPHPLGI